MVSKDKTRACRCPVEMGWTIAGGVAGVVGSLAFTFWPDSPTWVVKIAVPLQLMGAALLSHWFCMVKIFQSSSRKRWLLVITAILAGISLVLLLWFNLSGVVKWIVEMALGCATSVLFYATEPSDSK